MEKSIPQHNIKHGSQDIIYHLSNYEGKDDMTDSCTFTFEFDQTMEGSDEKIDYTTKCLSSRGVKSTIHLSNYNIIKI